MCLPEVGKEKEKGMFQGQGIGIELMGVPGSGKGTEALSPSPEWSRSGFSSAAGGEISLHRTCRG